jgi:hypothetical protein
MEYTIEVHPWNLFPKKTPIKKLIIGSFPPNKMVIKLGCKMKYIDEIVKVNKRVTKSFDFFYGSQQNKFWSLFFKSKGGYLICVLIQKLQFQKIKFILNPNILNLKSLICKNYI